MTVSRFACLALVVGAVAIGAGCGGSQAQVPSATAMGALSRLNSDRLLYIADPGEEVVDAFSYPRGTFVGELSGFQGPQALCADPVGSTKYFFIVSWQNARIYEYEGGGSSPIDTLTDGDDVPNGCAIDPVNGDVAVTNLRGPGSGPGNVVIYKKRHGVLSTQPSFSISSPAIKYFYYACFDEAGNLYVDGETQSYAFRLAMVPAGRERKLRILSVNQTIEQPGAVQWDGKYVAVGDVVTPSVIYQFSIAGRQATEVGSTTLDQSTSVGQFWIDGSRVIGPDYSRGDVGFWNYPGGGDPTKLISNFGFDSPGAAVVVNGR